MDIKYVETTQLSIEYMEGGPQSGQPVIFLHGWPDCADTWSEIAIAFQNHGYYTFIPALRGSGNTTFLSNQTRRTGSFEAFAMDIKEFIEALGLESVILIGQDWGGFTSLTMSSLWGRQLIDAEIVLSEGWQTFNQLTIKQIQDYWYQWYMITEQGKTYLEQHRNSFVNHLWKTWSPNYQLSNESKSILEKSIANQDWADITLNCYRTRWGYAPRDGFYSPLQQQIASNPQIDVPTLNIVGAADSCTDISMLQKMDQYFVNQFDQEFWPNVGHFIQREVPDKFIERSLSWLDLIL